MAFNYSRAISQMNLMTLDMVKKKAVKQANKVDTLDTPLEGYKAISSLSHRKVTMRHTNNKHQRSAYTRKRSINDLSKPPK